jgi:methionyl-tRNA synthetase
MDQNNKQLHQVENACPSCGSFYRRGDQCNMCGMIAPEKPEEITRIINCAPAGRLWSKSRHRYLTEKEIKAGERGG